MFDYKQFWVAKFEYEINFWISYNADEIFDKKDQNFREISIIK